MNGNCFPPCYLKNHYNRDHTNRFQEHYRHTHLKASKFHDKNFFCFVSFWSFFLNIWQKYPNQGIKTEWKLYYFFFLENRHACVCVCVGCTNSKKKHCIFYHACLKHNIKMASLHFIHIYGAHLIKFFLFFFW